MTSLRELIRTGSAGRVAIGSTLEDVIDALGEPTDRSVIRPDILKFGRLEVTLVDGRVALIAFYAGAPDEGDPVEDDVPERPEAMEAWLREERIEFEVHEWFTYDDQYALRIPASGAAVAFERGRLRSIQVPAG